MTTINKSVFGVAKYTLKSETVEVTLIEFGASVLSVKFADKVGKVDDVVAGFENVIDYERNTKYIGATVGRVANRTGEGRFTLNGQEYNMSINNGPNHLHGGFIGFDKKIWSSSPCENGVCFSLQSPDGDEGCPGNLEVTVTYTLIGNELKINYEATCDKDTPINLTNHTYFNLSGHTNWGSLEEHTVVVDADNYTPLDENLVTTGEIREVKGTLFDLRNPVSLTNSRLEEVGNGYDHNFCLNGYKTKTRHFAACLKHKATGRTVTVETTQPGMQLYTANFLSGEVGKSGVKYEYQTAVCMETQNWPDAINKPDIFPNGVLKTGEKYDHTTWFTFSVSP